ncbi:hypothetical protein [Rhodanobacter geophilus]|uniref:Uncharacterized protein n=1 Tax=Rhodanobacter geophilus TaxID=3162488 RepID=A0ABV3QL33_9GAMM
MPDRFIPRHAGYLLLVAGLAVAGMVMAVPARAAGHRYDAAPAPLSVHIRGDRMTLRVARAPQVYLAGTFNAAAVQQVQQLLQSGKVLPGADVYLDSSGGDVAAGMELGKLFRAARLNTHLGTWHTGTAPALPATCLDACAYAWLGGVYRWSPSGADRIGLHEASLPATDSVAPGATESKDPRGYLESMGVLPADFAQVLAPAVGGVVWWKLEKLVPAQVANNGRLPLVASYRKAPGDAPQLLLTQTVRGHQNQVDLQCAPGRITLSARYAVGDERAPLLAARAMYAYFVVGEQAWQAHQGERPHAEGEALVFTRQMPFAQLASVLQTVSLGAWIEITGSPVRLGFWLAPSQVEKLTQPFYADCQALQPGYVPPKAPAGHAKPPFWKRIFGRKS